MDRKDALWLEALQGVNLEELQYKPGHQFPDFPISVLSDFGHLAHELDDIEQKYPSIEADDELSIPQYSKPPAGKAPGLAPAHLSASRNTYAVPLLSLTKDKFKGLSKDSSKGYPIHLSLCECENLSADRKRRGISWEFKPPKSTKDPGLYAKMAPVNNTKYNLLQRRRIRVELQRRRSGERADDSEDESLSDDNGQYDSDYLSEDDTFIRKGETVGVAADLGTPEIEMEGMSNSGYDGSDDMTERADSEMRESSVASSVADVITADDNGRPYKGGKLSWSGPNGVIQSWSPERSESVESGQSSMFWTSENIGCLFLKLEVMNE
ncbi:hypothetical protein IFR04_015283 [Cadophora malorum]|uniref:Uncharacterized protein n=1 Tax=Cadophora malorum TaxID=108018 RepID=A0A8H7T235_9HELO|nr:hypothetical protein IFR04_015283 [Cadophora malorum]